MLDGFAADARRMWGHVRPPGRARTWATAPVQPWLGHPASPMSECAGEPVVQGRLKGAQAHPPTYGFGCLFRGSIPGAGGTAMGAKGSVRTRASGPAPNRPSRPHGAGGSLC